MRFLVPLVALLLMPGAAFACGGGDRSAKAAGAGGDECPRYTHEAWVRPYTGASFNTRGQFVLGVEGQYLVLDHLAVVTSWDYLWAYWVYSESNGEAGLQRDDELCDQGGSAPSDTPWC